MNNSQRLSEAQARQLLAAEIEKVGTQAAFADGNRIPRSYLNDVVHGRRDLSQSILDALGLVKVIEFEKKKLKR
jgi:hypothetical protein